MTNRRPAARRASRLPPWLTRPVVAWAIYDVASSTYVALVPTFFGVVFLAAHVGDPAIAQARWGGIAAVSLLVAGLLAPVVGAWSDRRGRWFGPVAAATTLCIAATLAMPGVAGQALALAALFFVAQVSQILAGAVYDSLLVRVTSSRHVGRVSGFGWACGFVGGITSLAAALVLMRGTPEDAQAALLPYAFLVAGLLYALFAVPGLAGLRGLVPALSSNAAASASLADALRAVATTLRRWREQREPFRFLLAYYLFNDVLVTLVFFIAIVLRARFGLTVEGLLWLALLYHVVALPATLAFGLVADHWGQRRTIYLQVAILGTAIALLALGSGAGVPVAVIVLLGLVYGSLQAVCRSTLALLVDEHRSAEIFGFNAMAGRVSAAIGPILFGAVAAITGSQPFALLSLLPFLLAGAWVLRAVRIPEAKAGGGTPAREPG
jgi:MFS transporter, UMF1 family